MKVMFITAIELMGKCLEQTDAIWQDIEYMAVVAHQEALNINKHRWESRLGTRDVGIVTPGGSMKLGLPLPICVWKICIIHRPVIGM